MTTDNIRSRIKDALSATIPDADFLEAATDLLAALDYRSERTLGLSGDFDDFIEAFPARNLDTGSEQEFRDNVQSVHIVFQFTDTEIQAGPQTSLLNADNFDKGNNKSFFFAVVELNSGSYPRGRYAQFTREINKRFPMPIVALFKTPDNLLTLAFARRRVHRLNEDRDVIGSVSLVREIDLQNPHRAHLDILADLSLDDRLQWMSANNKQQTFDGLLDAWLNALDTEELNKRFYKDLFAWFERAVKTATFPTKQTKTIPPEEHVIRLITRLLFIWFIKEKGLVADDLFNEEQIDKLLKDYDRANGDSYYRAVLQNLFFATLNTEIDDRRWSKESNETHRNFSCYRYENEMRDSKSLPDLFAKTPFINGGLFDCLDSEEATSDGGYRIDCFTDNPAHRRELSIPNHLFFDDSATAPGLIPLFNKYKFTVEENTPVDQEVALDPELLGKVFENLLAAYTPETKGTVSKLNKKKQTGSYYTPREVVDYMVEEALIGTLTQRAQPDDGDTDFWQERLRYLLDYEDAFNDASDLFEPKETESVIKAIAEIKALDPAVGSGAFPMGILHKLTLALRRLDPDNKQWEQLQKVLATQRVADAFSTADQPERDAELVEISATFQRYRDSDFGRKLYLIQNSIFGVDIQLIACQIAKLRFFISLAIEQQPNQDRNDNYGIKPLPNLETRFVAADTLLGLERPSQLTLGQTDSVKKLEAELAANRERHFHATTRHQKLACRRKDGDLRSKLAKELQKTGFNAATADKIAHWAPYDQNAKADWFDSEYMFGVADGFDVVIGNPPYIQLQKDGGKLGTKYEKAGFTTFVRSGDIYQLFYEKGFDLLKPKHGLLSYITSNSWLKAEYGKSTRRHLAERYTPLRLLEMGKDVFKNAIVDISIFIARSGKSSEAGKAVDMERLSSKHFPPDENNWVDFNPGGGEPWSVLSATERSIMDKMKAMGTPLKEWDISIYRGVTTGYNAAFIIDNQTKEALIAADAKSAEIIKPVLRGRDIQRYQAQWAGLWLIYARKGIDMAHYPAVYKHLWQYKEKLHRKAGTNQWYELQASPSNNLDSCFTREKLVWMDLTEQGRFAYDKDGTFCVNTAFMMSGLSMKYLCAALNSTLIAWFICNTALNSGMGVPRWIRHTVETIPIPKITTTKQQPFVHLVERILQAKTSNSAANISTDRTEIDWLVYELYGLTLNEIRTVEEYFTRNGIVKS